MLSSLKEVIGIVQEEKRGLAAFNVFGYEDAAAVIRAAEKTRQPVVLMTNKVAVSHMGIPILAKILLTMADSSSVPVCIHLDHATELKSIREAVASGYSSVMIDGSQLSYEDNVEITRAAVAIAGPRGVNVEAEIGSVGYSDADGVKGRFTDPGEARSFVESTRIDALAVAVGTVHRMEEQGVELQYDLLRQIHSKVEVPLVIHGATGVEDRDLRKLVECGACKINMGTALRIEFGSSLRRQFEEDPKVFDRIYMFQKCMESVEIKAIKKICSLK